MSRKTGISGPFLHLDKDIKDRTKGMIKRKRYIFENVIEVEEYHDGKYGAPGMKREKKRKATKEQMERVNQWNKEKKARHRMRKYFKVGQDWFTTLTYRKDARPPDMRTAKKQFSDFMKKLRKEFKKRGYELRWIRNIENTPTNNWHIHLALTDLPGTNIISIMSKLWPYGKVKDPQLLYEKGEMGELAAYITKTEKTKKEQVPDGVLDHKITESSFSVSRNMPLPEPKVDTLKRWRKEPKAKEGFYIDPNTFFEGTNPYTGHNYRHYTMVRIKRRE